jgi:hypothetical protein
MLHRGHLQVNVVILLICILWIRIRVLSDRNMKLPICIGNRIFLFRGFFVRIFKTREEYGFL